MLGGKGRTVLYYCGHRTLWPHPHRGFLSPAAATRPQAAYAATPAKNVDAATVRQTLSESSRPTPPPFLCISHICFLCNFLWFLFLISLRSSLCLQLGSAARSLPAHFRNWFVSFGWCGLLFRVNEQDLIAVFSIRKLQRYVPPFLQYSLVCKPIRAASCYLHPLSAESASFAVDKRGYVVLDRSPAVWAFPKFHRRYEGAWLASVENGN